MITSLITFAEAAAEVFFSNFSCAAVKQNPLPWPQTYFLLSHVEIVSLFSVEFKASGKASATKENENKV